MRSSDSIEIELIRKVVLEHLLDRTFEIRPNPPVDFGRQQRLSIDQDLHITRYVL